MEGNCDAPANRRSAPNLEAETTEGPVRFHDWIDYRSLHLTSGKVQLVIRDAQAARAQAPHDLGGAGLRALQAAARGAAAIIRLLAKAGNWWRTYTIRRARIAAVRELHALDDRTLSDIGVSRSEWVVVHGRDAPRVHWASQSRSSHTSSSAEKPLRTRKVSHCAGGNRSACAPTR
jgi:uncharacterized protein YjiS (DUF1127 family)